IADYQVLIDLYPQSPKVAEAMLKLGYSRWELKAIIGAQSILDQLVAKYPDSAEAKQARPLLDKLTRRLNR
ncbi:MAG: tetratricopeptide repeat protein, partial [Gammaproteobacteria bacterium]|nr:tetratricopeptide repeat protein [Gammaproteobacteria bacterium]